MDSEHKINFAKWISDAMCYFSLKRLEQYNANDTSSINRAFIKASNWIIKDSGFAEFSAKLLDENFNDGKWLKVNFKEHNNLYHRNILVGLATKVCLITEKDFQYLNEESYAEYEGVLFILKRMHILFEENGKYVDLIDYMWHLTFMMFLVSVRRKDGVNEAIKLISDSCLHRKLYCNTVLKNDLNSVKYTSSMFKCIAIFHCNLDRPFLVEVGQKCVVVKELCSLGGPNTEKDNDDAELTNSNMTLQNQRTSLNETDIAEVVADLNEESVALTEKMQSGVSSNMTLQNQRTSLNETDIAKAVAYLNQESVALTEKLQSDAKVKVFNGSVVPPSKSRKRKNTARKSLPPGKCFKLSPAVSSAIASKVADVENVHQTPTIEIVAPNDINNGVPSNSSENVKKSCKSPHVNLAPIIVLNSGENEFYQDPVTFTGEKPVSVSKKPSINNISTDKVSDSSSSRQDPDISEGTGKEHEISAPNKSCSFENNAESNEDHTTSETVFKKPEVPLPRKSPINGFSSEKASIIGQSNGALKQKEPQAFVPKKSPKDIINLESCHEPITSKYKAKIPEKSASKKSNDSIRNSEESEKEQFNKDPNTSKYKAKIPEKSASKDSNDSIRNSRESENEQSNQDPNTSKYKAKIPEKSASKKSNDSIRNSKESEKEQFNKDPNTSKYKAKIPEKSASKDSNDSIRNSKESEKEQFNKDPNTSKYKAKIPEKLASKESNDSIRNSKESENEQFNKDPNISQYKAKIPEKSASKKSNDSIRISSESENEQSNQDPITSKYKFKKPTQSAVQNGKGLFQKQKVSSSKSPAHFDTFRDMFKNRHTNTSDKVLATTNGKSKSQGEQFSNNGSVVGGKESPHSKEVGHKKSRTQPSEAETESVDSNRFVAKLPNNKSTENAATKNGNLRGGTSVCNNDYDLESIGTISGMSYKSTDSSRGKSRRKWSLHQDFAIILGVDKFGIGQWQSICQHGIFRKTNITPVKIKDRWRTMLNNRLVIVDNYGQIVCLDSCFERFSAENSKNANDFSSNQVSRTASSSSHRKRQRLLLEKSSESNIHRVHPVDSDKRSTSEVRSPEIPTNHRSPKRNLLAPQPFSKEQPRVNGQKVTQVYEQLLKRRENIKLPKYSSAGKQHSRIIFLDSDSD